MKVRFTQKKKKLIAICLRVRSINESQHKRTPPFALLPFHRGRVLPMSFSIEAAPSSQKNPPNQKANSNLLNPFQSLMLYVGDLDGLTPLMCVFAFSVYFFKEVLIKKKRHFKRNNQVIQMVVRSSI